MSGLLRTIASRAAPAMRGHSVVPKAHIASKAPKDGLTAVETAVGLGGFFLAIVGPSGWVLAHLEDYKKKE